jgi:threonine dehydratase
MKLYGCEPYNYPKYASFNHAPSATIADGLRLENPHPQVQQAIAANGIQIGLVSEDEIRAALKELFDKQSLVVEPSSAITLAFIKKHAAELPEPICAILTGENIAFEDHRRLVAER